MNINLELFIWRIKIYKGKDVENMFSIDILEYVVDDEGYSDVRMLLIIDLLNIFEI